MCLIWSICGAAKPFVSFVLVVLTLTQPQPPGSCHIPSAPSRSLPTTFLHQARATPSTNHNSTGLELSTSSSFERKQTEVFTSTIKVHSSCGTGHFCDRNVQLGTFAGQSASASYLIELNSSLRPAQARARGDYHEFKQRPLNLVDLTDLRDLERAR